MPTHRRRRHFRNGRPVAETTVHTSGSAGPTAVSEDQASRLRAASIPEPECDESTRALIDHLRSLPEGAVVRWGDSAMGAGQPWAWGHSYVCMTHRSAGGGWDFTLLGPDHPDAESCTEPSWQIAAPYDLELHGVWDSADLDYAAQTAVRPGESPTPEAQAELMAAAVEHGAAPVVRGAWSAGRINETLAGWTRRWVGRQDLTFEWDPEWVDQDLLDRANEAMAAYERGEGVDMGDNLSASPQAFDQLAADPGGAARVIGALKDALGLGREAP